MYLLIIFLPLFGAISAGFFGYYIGYKGSSLITTICVGLTFLLSCLAFYEVGLAGSPCYISLFPWINIEIFNISWGFMFDSLTVVMLIVVTCVSTLVHLYSTEYMGHDPHLSRFMSYLSLFTFFMLILVTADNIVQMFIGWEGVGLCSYLLINFWYGRLQANKAALKAMIINRIGDFSLVLSILLIFYTFNAVDYATIFALTPAFFNNTFFLLNYELNVLNIIGLLIFIGAVGKSAQIGLHTWLPDAMEGPTPVSALIHAATMVTAGVFLIARCSPLFEYSSNVLILITILGSITAFIASTIGLLQNDLKKVIAYSTCSQLGYMMFACGMSNYTVGIFHLANHAFFKALLFLSAGSVIHAMSDEQDMRRMGGLIQILPFTYAMMLIGSLSLMGFPFLTGFYSKDIILELAYANYSLNGHFAYWLGTIAAFFTAFYSIRLLYLTFLNETNSYKKIIKNSHESPILMTLPLFILCLGSIFYGYINKDLFIGLGTHFWGNAIFVLPKNLLVIDSEFLPYNIKLIPVIFSIFGASLAYILYKYFNYYLFNLKVTNFGYKLYIFLNKKWFFDKINNEYIAQNLLYTGYNITYKNFDKGIVEFLGPEGLSLFIYNQSSYYNKLQSGFIYHYAFIIIISLIFFIIFVGLFEFFF
jgi:NADH-ubiquinone oxidoreductase chain 5